MDFFELAFNDRVALGGATHALRITADDLTETTANTAQALTVDVADGEVFELLATNLVTPFEDASDAAFNSTVLTVGDGSDTDRFLTSQQLNANGTVIDYATGAAAQGPSGHVYNTADTVDFTFGSMSAKALADIDTGELLVYYRKTKLTRFAPNN